MSGAGFPFCTMSPVATASKNRKSPTTSSCSFTLLSTVEEARAKRYFPLRQLRVSAAKGIAGIPSAAAIASKPLFHSSKNSLARSSFRLFVSSSFIFLLVIPAQTA